MAHLCRLRMFFCVLFSLVVAVYSFSFLLLTFHDLNRLSLVHTQYKTNEEEGKLIDVDMDANRLFLTGQCRHSVALVTVLFGNYDKQLRPQPHGFTSDLYAITDRSDLQENNSDWTVFVYTAHAFTDYVLHDAGLNSLRNNTHSRNRAKYIKLQLYRLPFLQCYRFVIWADATHKFVTTDISAVTASILSNKHPPIALFSHHERRGRLSAEYEATLQLTNRYWNNSYLGEWQPIQNTTTQWTFYKSQGYADRWWMSMRKQKTANANASLSFQLSSQTSPQIGVWLASFFMIDHHNRMVGQFFDDWLREIIRFSGSDQLSLSYVFWKYKWLPHSLPDGHIKGNPMINDLFIEMEHSS